MVQQMPLSPGPVSRRSSLAVSKAGPLAKQTASSGSRGPSAVWLKQENPSFSSIILANPLLFMETPVQKSPPFKLFRAGMWTRKWNIFLVAVETLGCFMYPNMFLWYVKYWRSSSCTVSTRMSFLCLVPTAPSVQIKDSSFGFMRKCTSAFPV